MFEDQLSDQAEFTEIADKSNGNVPPKTIETFYTIVKGCLKSSEKRRLTINKVNIKANCYQAIYLFLYIINIHDTLYNRFYNSGTNLLMATIVSNKQGHTCKWKKC